jgi:pimeloyl-ACP methyl ester carboxylesterase
MSAPHSIRLTATLLTLVVATACRNPSAEPASTPDRPTGPDRVTGFEERQVERGEHRLHVREQPGEEPTIVLMHGFPDNHHLYDRLVPHLAGRHVVTFDFLGWGESDKPADHEYTFANQTRDLDAVITGLGLEQVVLVPHDASGPAAINWALDHQDQVAAIVALNTFYSLPPDSSPNPPEAIRLFSDPAFRRLTDHFADSPEQFRWLYDFQVGGFIQTPEVRAAFVPLLYRQFDDEPSTVEPFLELNADINAAVLANTHRHPELATFHVPVRFAFGENDPYLTADHGQALAALFPRAEAVTITGAGHFPQLDAPTDTAEQILTTPTTPR